MQSRPLKPSQNTAFVSISSDPFLKFANEKPTFSSESVGFLVAFLYPKMRKGSAQHQSETPEPRLLHSKRRKAMDTPWPSTLVNAFVKLCVGEFYSAFFPAALALAQRARAAAAILALAAALIVRVFAALPFLGSPFSPRNLAQRAR